MQGAVLRRQGSLSIFSSGTIGSCCLTIGAYFSEVSTHIFSTGHIPEKRSTVNCNSVLPQPSTSMNCLGQSDVLIGQIRLPTPPAIITTWLRLVILYLHYTIGQKVHLHPRKFTTQIYTKKTTRTTRIIDYSFQHKPGEVEHKIFFY